MKKKFMKKKFGLSSCDIFVFGNDSFLSIFKKNFNSRYLDYVCGINDVGIFKIRYD